MFVSMKRFRDTDYYITEDGRVWSNKRDKFLKPQRSGKTRSYLQVRIDGQLFPVHRLVLEVYRGIPDGLHVDHLDGDTFNNHIDNLEAVTLQENNLRAKKSGLPLYIVSGVDKGRTFYSYRRSGKSLKQSVDLEKILAFKKNYENNLK